MSEQKKKRQEKYKTRNKGLEFYRREKSKLKSRGKLVSQKDRKERLNLV